MIRWYIDDYLYLTKTAAELDPEFWPFNQNFHMLLNLAVGGNFPGDPDPSVFPQTMEVDYVRVYQGQFPYLTGKREVANAATSEVYSVENAKAGSTFNWTVPTGATITAGQGTNSITVDLGSTAGIGTISATEGSGCTTNTIEMKVKVDLSRVEILECVFENFDTDPLITLLSSSNQGETGTIVEDFTNPAPNAVNSSNLVAKYTRSTNTFDNFQYSTTAIVDASKFITGDKTFFMDVYTSAEPGKVITLQLENLDKVGDFPAGRHSRYLATTTVKNAWERLEFKSPERLDGATLDNEVDRVVFLFDANSDNTDTYYFDNFDKYCTSTVGECAAVSPCIAPAICKITNLTAGVCPNGASGTELITVRDADNPNCSASIEAPVCSDGSTVAISFTTSGSDVSNSFQLWANGALRSTGGSTGIFPANSPTLEEMDFSITDPCSCDNPHNLTLPDGTFLFEDTVKIDASAFLPGPIAVTLFSQDGNLLTAAGVPYTTATATFLDLGNGMYGLPFYTKPNIPSTIMAQVNGGVPKSFTTDSCSVCVATEPIPTMSEWGLMIFGLLMLNLGLMFIYRKEAHMNL